MEEEVDVMSKWPEEQKSLVESMKWMERKQALEALLTLLEQSPRLATNKLSSYQALMEQLKKVV